MPQRAIKILSRTCFSDDVDDDDDDIDDDESGEDSKSEITAAFRVGWS